MAVDLIGDRPEAHKRINALTPTATAVPPTATSVPVPTQVPPTAAPALTGDALLIAKVEAALPKEAKGKVHVESHYLTAFYTQADGPDSRGTGRQAARNGMFAAYSAGLPVNEVTISITPSDGKGLGLFVTLGANVAATQPVGTWSQSSIQLGPTIFLDWMKQQKLVHGSDRGADAALIGGLWAN